MNPNLLYQIAGQFNGFSKEEIARETTKDGEYGFSNCERKIVELLIADGRFLKWAEDGTLMIPDKIQSVSQNKSDSFVKSFEKKTAKELGIDLNMKLEEEEQLKDDEGFDIDKNGIRIDSDHNMYLKQDLGLEEF